MSLRNELKHLLPSETISINTGKIGDMKVQVDGETVYEYKTDGAMSTADLSKRVVSFATSPPRDARTAQA